MIQAAATQEKGNAWHESFSHRTRSGAGVQRLSSQRNRHNTASILIKIIEPEEEKKLKQLEHS